MSHPFYRITAKEEGFGYILFNEASGGPCGDRLNKGGQWPFGKEERWMEYEDESSATKAALRLQRYLETKDPAPKSKAKEL